MSIASREKPLGHTDYLTSVTPLGRLVRQDGMGQATLIPEENPGTWFGPTKLGLEGKGYK